MPRLAKHRPYLEDALLHLIEKHKEDAFVLLYELSDKVTAQQMPQSQRLRQLGQALRARKPKLDLLDRRNTY